MIKSYFKICLLLTFISGCQPKENSIEPSFYHWKSSLSLQIEERNYLDKLNVQKIYLKFFDVDWNLNQKTAIPLASLQINPQHLKGLNLVPTIFITNRTLIHLPTNRLEELADKIVKKVQEIQKDLPLRQIQEIQFDCDWSLKTKANYFNLLELLKLRLKNIELSATIRLHQIKYFHQTGIPPVNRGMLMFYNMGDLGNPEAHNTILDLTIAKKYLAKLDQYPLDLDIALPLFSWGVLLRDNKMIQLINNLSVQELKGSKRFLKLDENRFKVLESTYLNACYLYQDDQIRLEQVSTAQLIQAAKLLAAHVKPIDRSISFYHLDTTVIKHYPYEILETVCNYFR